MIKTNGIIHLKDENIAVESLEVIGHIKKTLGEPLTIIDECNLVLEDNDQYLKLLDLDSFDIEFDDMIIPKCKLLKGSNFKENIESLGYLQCVAPPNYLKDLID